MRFLSFIIFLGLLQASPLFADSICSSTLRKALREIFPPMPASAFIIPVDPLRRNAGTMVLNTFFGATGATRDRLPKALGKGGFGIVFLDPHAKGGPTAVKVPLRSDFQEETVWLDKRFFELEQQVYADAYATGKSGRDYLLPAEYVETAAGPAVKYPYMEQNLETETGKLLPTQALETGLQLLDAIDALHAADWAHNDIKPQNIYRAPDGTIRVSDYGISKKLQTRYQGFIGTPLYVPMKYQTGGTAQILDVDKDLFAILRTLDALLLRKREPIHELDGYDLEVRGKRFTFPKYSRYTLYQMAHVGEAAPSLSEQEDRVFRMISSLHQARATFFHSQDLRDFLLAAKNANTPEKLDRWYRAYFAHLSHSLGSYDGGGNIRDTALISTKDLSNIILSDLTSAQYLVDNKTGLNPLILKGLADVLKKEIRRTNEPAIEDLRRDTFHTAGYRIPKFVGRVLEETEVPTR